ncbi:MAG: DNA repair protein RecO [Bacteroidetes bacterium]|nr:MAG: DNA repair protein RecO [Bacteroidota bacterium]
MNITGRGIVIQCTRYSETSVIARIFTREMGMQSFMVPGVRSNKGAIRSSHLQPLNLLELVMQIRQSASLQRIRELRCTPVLSSIHYDPKKSGIAMFMLEILNRAIREEERNEKLFDFLWTSIQILDLKEQGIAPFPIHFLVQLSRYLGFYPAAETYQEGYCFDMEEGGFFLQVSATEEDKLIAQSLFKLLNKDFDQLEEVKLGHAMRQQVLNLLLNYYRIHLHNFKEFNSPAILKEILSA